MKFAIPKVSTQNVSFMKFWWNAKALITNSTAKQVKVFYYIKLLIKSIIFLHLVIDQIISLLINSILVGDHLRSLYQQAGGLRYWMVVRYCSSLLNHTVDSISPFITGVLVKGKQVFYLRLYLPILIYFHFTSLQQ